MNQLHHRELRDFSLLRELCAEAHMLQPWCSYLLEQRAVLPPLHSRGLSDRLLRPNGQFESESNLFGMVKKMGSLGESKRGNEARKPMTWVFEILWPHFYRGPPASSISTHWILNPTPALHFFFNFYWSIVALPCGYFLLYHKANQLYVHIHALFFGFPPHLGPHSALSRVPWAVQSFCTAECVSCPVVRLTLCDPMDYSLPDSSVHGIL